jgi:hypothetical protein
LENRLSKNLAHLFLNISDKFLHTNSNDSVLLVANLTPLLGNATQNTHEVEEPVLLGYARVIGSRCKLQWDKSVTVSYTGIEK